MFSLDTGDRGLVLPQLDLSDFADSLWEALCCLRNGSGLGLGKRVGEKEERRKAELWSACKMKKKFKKFKKDFEIASSYTWVLRLQLPIQLSYLTALDATFVDYSLKYLWSF